ncbi:MAG: hypothetical protein J6C37_01315 [Roseburia sp.]|nr:hypothetical protein [Roseburia sp.]
MRSDNREVKKCSICGKHFITNKSRVVCCSPECQKKRNKEIQNEARRKYVSQKEPKKKKKTLEEISVEARAAGMTYGQYVAQMGL